MQLARSSKVRIALESVKYLGCVVDIDVGANLLRGKWSGSTSTSLPNPQHQTFGRPHPQHSLKRGAFRFPDGLLIFVFPKVRQILGRCWSPIIDLGSGSICITIPSVSRSQIERASALCFIPRDTCPKHVITTVIAETKDIDIPPGADNVRPDAYYKMEKPVRLTAYQPHMHNRGKAQCMEAIYPNMTVEQLNCVNRYNFGWQIVYNYADDVAPLLPAGTIIHLTSWHDNSTKNPWNPDPRAWVGYGERTTEDMSRAWLNFYYLSDEDFKAEVVARKAQKLKLTSQR
jgi:hypothetical protein